MSISETSIPCSVNSEHETNASAFVSANFRNDSMKPTDHSNQKPTEHEQQIVRLRDWLELNSHDGEFDGVEFTFNWTFEYSEDLEPKTNPNETFSLFVKGSDDKGWRAKVAYLCDGNGHRQAFVPLNTEIRGEADVMKLLDAIGML